MKWSYKEPSYGDMIRVAVGSIYHFGIYASDEEVIQFGLPPSRRANLSDADVEVLSAGIDEFLAGGFLEVCEFDKKEKKKNRSPDEIVAYARSKIGMRGYHILYNNCEHFANECVNGQQICRQAEDVRALFRKMPVVDVYVATLPKGAPIGTLECKERMKEISSAGSETEKRRKYFVWKLLCYALERSFGLRGKKLDFTKKKYGGWAVSGAEISISHSGNALVVAVSRAAVGVDVEPVEKGRELPLAEQIMTESELSEYGAVPESQKRERLLEIWTAKEAVFKSKKEESFVPSKISLSARTVRTEGVTLAGENYILSIATETPEKIRIFEDIDLMKIN